MENSNSAKLTPYQIKMISELIKDGHWNECSIQIMTPKETLNSVGDFDCQCFEQERQEEGEIEFQSRFNDYKSNGYRQESD